jgi:hypothetical protein
MSHTAAPTTAHPSAPSAAPHHAGAYPSDEQILGISDDAAAANDAAFDALLANAAANANGGPGLPVAQPGSKGWGSSQEFARTSTGTSTNSSSGETDPLSDGASPSAAKDPTPSHRGGLQNPASPAQSNFDPAAYAQFEQSTNDAVVADVNRAIERALDRALPDNIADGARRRIAGDTLAEVHAALRGDRELATQVVESLRSGNFSAATRDAVARLIATRARGVVPEAARRVIGEWTGSVLASHRDRAAKTQAASARVDVTGGALAGPVPRRAVAPSEINYRATSDEDILSW